MVELFGGASKRARGALLRVAVDPIRIHLGELLDQSFRIRNLFVMCSLIPQHAGEKYAHIAPVKVRHHGSNAFGTAWHVAEQIVLVAVVDPDI